MIDWKTVDPRYFEKFIFHFLKELGFRNREWFGRGGGDRGRDVCATWYEELPFGMGYQRKWIFQCKRWKTMPSTGDIYEEISKAVQHQPDHWVMVIPLDPTSSVIDYFIKMELNFGIKLSIIPLSQLEEIIVEFPYLLSVLTEGYISERGGANEVRI
ncbi:restriction endonuclease [Sporosarcina sp. Marseille-Q4063]|uniref:restriction endonuclease n=1 Tax=Sporosarcina sp. Marseille-Q4063 TaxID=2810514 RepID=UPI001BAFBD81|nr:restriction endonuclease [Sporosarcina sp. Marseille-Q4063]QUW23373.1 restriction endonuclease [Sporosarcina sp. Marseille-Q4063]